MTDEVDIAGDLASASESYNGQHDHVVDENITITSIEQKYESHVPKLTIANPVHELNADQLFVATSQGILSADQLSAAGISLNLNNSLKNCIIIQDQATFDNLNLTQGLRAVGVGSNPLIASAQVDDRTRTITTKYQWDESVYENILPVRCKDTNGELHKRKFGSG